MTKRTLGYVEMEWTCPNCGGKNPGMKKACANCGAPQPASVQFELGQNREMIADAEKSAGAARGADVHCPYCGTRNPSGAQECAQCGGDLKEGLRRESGKVLAAQPAPAAGPRKCPNCGTENSSAGATCSACGALLSAPKASPIAATPAPVEKVSAFRPWMALPIVAVILLCCLVLGFVFLRTEAQVGTVERVAWERVIPILALRDVTKSAWEDEIPQGLPVLSCEEKLRGQQDTPTDNSREICATQYVDQGNGAAEVVETCYYEVYANFCQYTDQELQEVDRAVASGTDLLPYSPQPRLSAGQTAGDEQEQYIIFFETQDGVKEYSTTNAALFSQFEVGSQWTLSINTFGQIVDVSP